MFPDRVYSKENKKSSRKIVQSIGEAGIEKLLKDAEVRELIQIFCSSQLSGVLL